MEQMGTREGYVWGRREKRIEEEIGNRRKRVVGGRRQGGTTQARRREAVGAARGPPEDAEGPTDESWASAAEAGPRKRGDEKPSPQRAVRLRTGRDLRTSRRRAASRRTTPSRRREA